MMEMGMYGLGLILAVLLGAFAIVVTVAKPGKNAQAIRAVSVVAICAGAFLLGLVAGVWSILDYVLPNKKQILKQAKKRK